MRKTKVLLSLLALCLFTMMATGCVFGPKDEDSSGQIDPPQLDYTVQGQDPTDIVFQFDDQAEEMGLETDASTLDSGDITMASDRMVERTLYVFDHQGYVAPITVQVPYRVEVATQALEYLVVDGPITEHLPSGMRAVLPAGTELSVHIKEDGTALVDFSKEFKDYKAEDEKGILEAITWTLTEFDTIKQVKFMINGYETNVMPVNQTPINESFSRKDGINVEIASGTNLGRATAVTLYFKAQNSAATTEYYVPVTRIVPRSDDLVMTTIKELIAGPKAGSGLVSGILPSTEVLSVDQKEETVVLNFDETLLQYSQDESKASDDAIQSVVLSLTETGNFEQVQFMVNGDTKVTSYNGSDLSKPVARPIAINQTGF